MFNPKAKENSNSIQIQQNKMKYEILTLSSVQVWSLAMYLELNKISKYCMTEVMV